jgi:hypothetical protein
VRNPGADCGGSCRPAALRCLSLSTPPRPKGSLTGRCFCGAVEYEVADEFVYAANCHCSNCRRATGAAFKSFAGIERSKLRITRGEDALFTFGEETACDKRCRSCGSFLFSIVSQGARVHIGMGTLVDTPSIRPSAHIFVGSKAPWFDITDDLPQYIEHVIPALDPEK